VLVQNTNRNKGQDNDWSNFLFDRTLVVEMKRKLIIGYFKFGTGCVDDFMSKLNLEFF
jgi:hypothetical protein